MAETLLGTSTYLVYCRAHGVVGRALTTDDANDIAETHWAFSHSGHGRDQTDADNSTATDAELFIGQANVTVPTDVSSSSSSA
jgi:hypothetical protein